MTTRHRIRAEQLQVGGPLPVDVYDADNRLLLRRGNVIATESQLERLIEYGMFSDEPLPVRRPAGADDAAAHSQAAAASDPLIDGPLRHHAPRPTAKVSVYAEVVATARTLEQLLCAPSANPDFVHDIAQLAAGLRRACTLDPDAALAHILFARDVRYPVRQAINVAIISALLLERLGHAPDRIHSAVAAALTMNLSMLDVQHVLYRQQTMDDAQRAAVAEHPLASRRALEALGVADALWLTVVEQHHEFIDGTGYPHRLAGETVLREAQVVGLADRYCGVVTERAYRPAIAPDAAIEQIRTKSGTAIDPLLIAELVHWLGLYPPGTVVELFNREVAVVTRRLRDPRHPVVFAVCGQNLRPFESPRKRMTASQPQYRIERVFARDTIKFPVDPETLWPRTVIDEPVAA